MAKSSRLPAQTERIREKTDQRITTRSHIRYVRDVRNVLGFLSPYFLFFNNFFLLYFISAILFNLFFSVVLTNFWITENTLKGEGSLFTLPVERMPLSDEHFCDFPPYLISVFMWMQIIASVPLNLYRTPSKAVRATIQKKFFNIYIYVCICIYIFRVRRAGETGIILSDWRGDKSIMWWSVWKAIFLSPRNLSRNINLNI